MSFKKGYTYENISEFCRKYGCKLLALENDILKCPENFKIKSRCGHESIVSFKGLLNKRRGIYCYNCFEKFKKIGIECIKCSKIFFHVNDGPLFCSSECSHSRIVSEEQKQKVRTAICKNFGYYDENGDLMDSMEDVKLRKVKRGEKYRRDKGMKEKFVYTYESTKGAYEKEGCVLLSNEDEYNKISKLEITERRFKFRAKCGHIITNTRFSDFIYQKAHVYCDDCSTKKLIDESNKGDGSKVNGVPKRMITEKTGVEYIKQLCFDSFEINKTREACSVDILIRPIGEENDLWLPAQLKVTSPVN
jgi:hypothetical protein